MIDIFVPITVLTINGASPIFINLFKTCTPFLKALVGNYEKRVLLTNAKTNTKGKALTAATNDYFHCCLAYLLSSQLTVHCFGL